MKLTPKDRAQLENVIRADIVTTADLVSARVLLMLDNAHGDPALDDEEVAKILDISPTVIQQVRYNFVINARVGASVSGSTVTASATERIIPSEGRQSDNIVNLSDGSFHSEVISYAAPFRKPRRNSWLSVLSIVVAYVAIQIWGLSYFDEGISAAEVLENVKIGRNVGVLVDLIALGIALLARHRVRCPAGLSFAAISISGIVVPSILVFGDAWHINGWAIGFIFILYPILCYVASEILSRWSRGR